MKYSFMSFSCPQLTLGELLATARRFGYDGVEPRLDRQHRHGVENTASAARRKEIQKQAAADGGALSLAGGYFYSTCLAALRSAPVNSVTALSGKALRVA